MAHSRIMEGKYKVRTTHYLLCYHGELVHSVLNGIVYNTEPLRAHGAIEHVVAYNDEDAIKAWEVQHGYCRANQLPD